MPKPDVHSWVQHRSREPNLGFAEQRNVRGENSDDGQAGAVHADGAPQDIAIATEVALPDSIAENGHLWKIHLLVGLNKITTEHRVNAEAPEKVCGCDGDQNLFRFVTRKV